MRICKQQKALPNRWRFCTHTESARNGQRGQGNKVWFVTHPRPCLPRLSSYTRAPIPSAHVPQEWTSVTSIQQTQSPYRILILSYFASAKWSCSQMITMRYFVTTIRKPCPALFSNLASTTWHTCNQVRVFFFGLVGLCGTFVKLKLISKFLKFTKP